MNYFMGVDGRPSQRFLSEKRKWLISVVDNNGRKITINISFSCMYGRSHRNMLGVPRMFQISHEKYHDNIVFVKKQLSLKVGCKLDTEK